MEKIENWNEDILQSWLESVITCFTDFIVKRSKQSIQDNFPKRKQMIALCLLRTGAILAIC